MEIARASSDVAGVRRVPALGAPFGRYDIGGLEVIHDDTGVRTVDGVLAGSALELDRAVRNLMAYTGCSLPDALATVTSTPADLIGLADRGREPAAHRRRRRDRVVSLLTPAVLVNKFTSERWNC